MAELDIQPRECRWAHLSLCVLDAVHSIGVRYETVKALCWKYGEPLLGTVLVAPAKVGTYVEQPLREFAEWAVELGEAELADALGNHHRTSTRRGAPLKTRADIEYAQILVRHGINLLGDAADLLGDAERLARVEADLATVPGHGWSGIRMNYLWMLVGSDDRIKPDRMVRRWLGRHLGREVGVGEAVELVTKLAAANDRTPWEVDHAIWRAQRSRPKRG
ncbi:hypothetical protein EV186_11431 [Labedaea rhizosphaerae]|uniref:Uncharacterized protein n=2 Tax=Labedaea rhizosphaerae TaxID=598644 RepID=A0A4R6RSG3_LABRH|nr:hypothetical protein EV186_11431 [Labedaea rhizosphaerae]